MSKHSGWNGLEWRIKLQMTHQTWQVSWTAMSEEQFQRIGNGSSLVPSIHWVIMPLWPQQITIIVVLDSALAPCPRIPRWALSKTTFFWGGHLERVHAKKCELPPSGLDIFRSQNVAGSRPLFQTHRHNNRPKKKNWVTSSDIFAKQFTVQSAKERINAAAGSNVHSPSWSSGEAAKPEPGQLRTWHWWCDKGSTERYKSLHMHIQTHG